MTTNEQITSLSEDLRKVVERYRCECDIPIAGYVGVLQMIMMDCYSACRGLVTEDDFEEEDDEGDEWKEPVT